MVPAHSAVAVHVAVHLCSTATWSKIGIEYAIVPPCQAKLECRKTPALLDTIIKQQSVETQTYEKVSVPSLASDDAANILVSLLKPGKRCKLFVSPSCVWTNSKYTGVSVTVKEILLAA